MLFCIKKIVRFANFIFMFRLLKTQLRSESNYHSLGSPKGVVLTAESVSDCMRHFVSYYLCLSCFEANASLEYKQLKIERKVGKNN